MSFARVLPAQFCLLLVAVLAMRLGFPLIMIVPLTGMLMLAALVPWSEVRALMTVVLGLCTLIWAVMTVMRVELRMAYEQPFIRLAAILGGVTLFNAWATWLLWSSRKTIRAELATAPAKP
ncbi:MAG: hypothetical protein LWW79_02650 [Holophagaceae bacterium]|nr:hypothetical protein [Holophagaceae bacterium]